MNLVVSIINFLEQWLLEMQPTHTFLYVWKDIKCSTAFISRRLESPKCPSAEDWLSITDWYYVQTAIIQPERFQGWSPDFHLHRQYHLICPWNCLPLSGYLPLLPKVAVSPTCLPPHLFFSNSLALALRRQKSINQTLRNWLWQFFLNVEILPHLIPLLASSTLRRQREKGWAKGQEMLPHLG